MKHYLKKNVIFALVFAVVILLGSFGVTAAKKKTKKHSEPKQYEITLGEMPDDVEVFVLETIGADGNISKEDINVKSLCAQYDDIKYRVAGWNIKGKYDILSGTLKSEELTILLKSDCKVTLKLRTYGEKDTYKPKWDSNEEAYEVDDSHSSRKAGSLIVFFSIFVCLFVFVVWAIQSRRNLALVTKRFFRNIRYKIRKKR